MPISCKVDFKNTYTNYIFILRSLLLLFVFQCSTNDLVFAMSQQSLVKYVLMIGLALSERRPQ